MKTQLTEEQQQAIERLHTVFSAFKEAFKPMADAAHQLVKAVYDANPELWEMLIALQKRKNPKLRSRRLKLQRMKNSF